jgi:hypothetical protein
MHRRRRDVFPAGRSQTMRELGEELSDRVEIGRVLGGRKRILVPTARCSVAGLMKPAYLS